MPKEMSKSSVADTTPSIEVVETSSRNNILLSAISLDALNHTINLPEYIAYDAVAYGTASEGRCFVLLRQRSSSSRTTIFKILYAHDRGGLEKEMNKFKDFDYNVKFMRVHHSTGVWSALLESLDNGM